MNNQTIEATLVKANKLKREGQVTEAVSFYRQAINTNPHFHWYYYYLGEALSTIGNLDEAITSFSNAIQLKPDIAWFHFSLGDALSKKGELEQAISSYSKAVELNKKCHIFYNSYQIALAKFNEYLAATEFLRLRDYQSVEEKISTVLQHFPNFKKALMTLAECARRTGDRQLALERYQSVIDKHPKYWLAHCEVATELIQLGNYQQAEEKLNQTLQQIPNYQTALMELARCARRMENRQLALERYRAVVSKYPQYWPAHYEVANELIALGKYQLAEETINQVLVHVPDQKRALKMLVECARCYGNRELVIKRLQVILSKYPNDWDTSREIIVELSYEKNHVDLAEASIAYCCNYIFSQSRKQNARELKQQNSLQEQFCFAFLELGVIDVPKNVWLQILNVFIFFSSIAFDREKRQDISKVSDLILSSSQISYDRKFSLLYGLLVIHKDSVSIFAFRKYIDSVYSKNMPTNHRDKAVIYMGLLILNKWSLNHFPKFLFDIYRQSKLFQEIKSKYSNVADVLEEKSQKYTPLFINNLVEEFQINSNTNFNVNDTPNNFLFVVSLLPAKKTSSHLKVIIDYSNLILHKVNGAKVNILITDERNFDRVMIPGGYTDCHIHAARMVEVIENWLSPEVMKSINFIYGSPISSDGYFPEICKAINDIQPDIAIVLGGVFMNSELWSRIFYYKFPTLYLPFNTRNRPTFDADIYLSLASVQQNAQQYFEEGYINPSRWRNHHYLYSMENIYTPFEAKKYEFTRVKKTLDCTAMVSAVFDFNKRVKGDTFIKQCMKILKKYPKVYWTIAGVFDFEELLSRDKDFQEMFAMDRVKLIRLEPDLRELYRLCDIYIHPNTAGGGRGVALAVSEGLPVLCYDECDSCNILDESVIFNNDDDYFNFLEHLICNVDLRKSVSKKLKYLLELHSIDNVANEFLGFCIEARKNFAARMR